MAEKAEEISTAAAMTRNTVAAKSAQGSISANDVAPKIDQKMTLRRPKRSMRKPPATVPNAPAAKKTKEHILRNIH
ncbi:MAG: hypothetical protein V8R49_03730 [Duodenibacillus massiliensis]